MLLLLSFETQVGLVLLKPIVWVVVVAQLAERLLPTPEIRGSNPDIGNKIFESHYLSIAIQKRRK